MTIGRSLRSVCGYPVPPDALARIVAARGLDGDGEATAEVTAGAAYRLAEADVCAYLSVAPDVSQEGVSYSLGEASRLRLRSRALAAYRELGDAAAASIAGVRYGYKGTRP